MTLTSVVLPAPFGPIRPWIDPCSTSSDTPSTAWTPPKWRWTLSRRSSTGARSRPPGRPHDRQAAAPDDSLRTENDDHDQEQAAEDVDVVLRALKDPGKQRDDHRAHHRSEDEAGAPEDGKGQDLHGARDVV